MQHSVSTPTGAKYHLLNYDRKPEISYQAAHRIQGIATLTARKEGIQPVCSLPSIDPPTPKHSSYLPGRGPHSGQFLSTSPLEPSDGIRAYSAHSGSNQKEIQWMGGILQYTLCQRLGI